VRIVSSKDDSPTIAFHRRMGEQSLALAFSADALAFCKKILIEDIIPGVFEIMALLFDSILSNC
jgi:hypothetical protein